MAVAADARDAGVDHRADAGHRERGLGDVRRQHDAAAARRLEHALLLFLRKPRVQRQHLATLRVVLAQRFGGLADLALAAQEHEDVARLLAPQLIDGGKDRGLLVDRGFVVFLVELDRPIAHLDGIAAARHIDDRRIAEVPREPLRIDRRRGDDDLEVRPLRQQPFQIAEQEVDVQRALVRLVDDDRVVRIEKAVALRLGEQDAVGHELDQPFRATAILEAQLVAD